MTTLELYHDAVRRLAATGIMDPKVEAVLLLRHFLGCRRADIFLNGSQPVADSVREEVERALSRRLDREPLAYILGEQEFYGRAFAVSPEVLIPRSETELLLDRALLAVRAMGKRLPRILDLGTGSGIIAITLALELPTAFVVALDLSVRALRIAQANSIRHQVTDRVHFLNADWGTSLRARCDFDLLVANPPYVAKEIAATLQPELAAEPALALYGGADGRTEIDRIMVDAARLVRPGGLLLMEIGFDQGEYVVAAMNCLGQFDHVEVHADYAGLPRILQARRRQCS